MGAGEGGSGLSVWWETASYQCQIVGEEVAVLVVAGGLLWGLFGVEGDPLPFHVVTEVWSHPMALLQPGRSALAVCCLAVSLLLLWG